MARFITVLSEANYVLAYDATPGIRKSMKRSSAKARRSLGRKAIKEALNVTRPGLEYLEYRDWTIEEKISDLIDGGAIPGCGCGCDGEYLADLIKTKRRGLSSVKELWKVQEQEQKQAEVNLLWSEYSAAS